MVRLGIIGCAEIAFRRFMPAALDVDGLKVVAVAEEYAPAKLESFKEEYGLETMTSFQELINRDDIDALYIPQPPALHFKWAKAALEKGKHVLVEKPSTTALSDSSELVRLASSKKLALHENYMFIYHSQIQEIKEIIASGKIGEVRLIRASFGFPMRAANDFRYNKTLGGGALLDAGGYTLKLATSFLGDSIRVTSSQMNSLPGFEVDMFGSASLVNDAGLVCQISYGMDNAYRCSMEIWGSTAYLSTNRIFTAPGDYEPVVVLESNTGREEIKLSKDSHFNHSIEAFINEINDASARDKMYKGIMLQASLVDALKNNGDIV